MMIMRKDTGTDVTVTATTVPAGQTEYATNNVSNAQVPVPNANTVTQVTTAGGTPVATTVGTPVETKADARKVWGIVGGVLGVAYGLYFAHKYTSADAPLYASNKYLRYFMWAVIFGLASFEAGERVGCIIKKVQG